MEPANPETLDSIESETGLLRSALPKNAAKLHTE